MSEQELIDVCDENGNLTGETLPRDQVHARELWHTAAFVWLYNSRGEVLLQLRAASKESFPSRWDVSAAGHISSGDTPTQAALREVEEELGLSAEEDELTYVGSVIDEFELVGGKMHHEYAHVYILQKDVQLRDITIQQSELTHVRWLPILKLEADLAMPGWEQIYAGRNHYIYNAAIDAIERKLQTMRQSQTEDE